MATLIQSIKCLESGINSKKTMLKNTINNSAPGTISETIPTFDKINKAITKIDFGLAPVFELITENQTWTCPSSIASNVSVRVFGGGGGGGTGSGSSYLGDDRFGGGGGSGHMTYKVVEISGGEKIQCTIGTGGNSEKAGSSSSFGNYASANGGSGAQSSRGGAGGSGGGGGCYDVGNEVWHGGGASYGGIGGDGFWSGTVIEIIKSGKGIDTTQLVNRFMILGSANGGTRDYSYSAGGGGGGYGGDGGSSHQQSGGGGGGGYGGNGGNGSGKDGSIGTGYACGGGGGGGYSTTDLSFGGPGTKGCILVSYLVKVRKESILPI